MSSGLEIERKFVIKKPDIKLISSLGGFTESHITQTYLESEPQVTLRVRRREYRDEVVYTETAKRRVDYISAEETEREITRSEYEEAVLNIKVGTKPVIKTRYTFSYGHRVYEIDVYPQWTESCIMEAELQSRDEPLEIPPFIEVIKEVTGDKSYSNASMSKVFPEEIRS